MKRTMTNGNPARHRHGGPHTRAKTPGFECKNTEKCEGVVGAKTDALLFCSTFGHDLSVDISLLVVVPLLVEGRKRPLGRA